MGAAVSLVVVAIGAVLRFATNVQSSTWNIRTIGDILMFAGAVGFVVSLVAMAYWDGFGPGSVSRRRRTRVVTSDREPVRGPDGYARTSYDGGRQQGGYPGVPMAPVVDHTRPYPTVIEEEERSLR